MSAILSAVVPVFFVAAAGYVVRRRFKMDARTLSTINIYVLIPALVFDSLYARPLEWRFFGLAAISILAFTAIMTAILTLISYLSKRDREQQSSLLMTMFPNMGNYGLPVVAFAFGREEAFSLAVVYMVCSSFLQNSLGVYFAQRSYSSFWNSVIRVFYFPMMYAFVLALVFQHTGWSAPEVVSRAVELTAGAAIPVQLILLGFQIAETKLITNREVLTAAFCRLALAPVIALLVATVVGLEGLGLRVFVLQLSGPVAVGMAAYGVQFNVRPAFMASVVAWTFFLSLFTVSGVLALLYAL